MGASQIDALAFRQETPFSYAGVNSALPDLRVARRRVAQRRVTRPVGHKSCYDPGQGPPRPFVAGSLRLLRASLCGERCLKHCKN